MMAFLDTKYEPWKERYWVHRIWRAYREREAVFPVYTMFSFKWSFIEKKTNYRGFILDENTSAHAICLGFHADNFRDLIHLVRQDSMSQCINGLNLIIRCSYFGWHILPLHHFWNKVTKKRRQQIMCLRNKDTEE